MLRLLSVLILAAVCLFGQQFAFARPGQVTAITNVEVFDATGAAPWQGTVLIRDGRIIEAGPKVKAPRGAKVIKGEGRALLPGFYSSKAKAARCCRAFMMSTPIGARAPRPPPCRKWPPTISPQA